MTTYHRSATIAERDLALQHVRRLHDEHHHLLDEAWAQLRRRDEAMAVYLQAHHYTVTEVAAALGITKQAVHMAVRRAVRWRQPGFDFGLANVTVSTHAGGEKTG